MPRTLAGRVSKLEGARPRCRVCGGNGRVAVIYTSRGETAYERPACAGCGRVVVIEVHEIPMEARRGRTAG